jgi:hypothetical protein
MLKYENYFFLSVICIILTSSVSNETCGFFATWVLIFNYGGFYEAQNHSD